jgi:ABC-type lipoprotein export system ATPase subunit
MLYGEKARRWNGREADMLGINRDRNGSNGKSHSDHLIELRQVVKQYQTAAGPFSALKGVDLRVNTGEFVAVVGKSGSGKSTLINMVTGIDRATSGEVLVADTPIHTMGENRLAAWRGRNVGVIFQFFQLLPSLTVIENVMLPMDFCHMYSGRERVERAMELLTQVEVPEQAHKLPSALSGGQQQRAAIARALANDPPILVADEPTGNLDTRTADSVFRLFERLVEQGKTILMVTHDQDLARRVSRTVILSDGEVIEDRLARVFPSLTPAQLIQATHGLEPERHAPGAIILREGEMPDALHIITRGQVDVLVTAPDGMQVVSARLTPGQYFGEIELLTGEANIATIRAGLESGVDLAVLDREAFMNVVKESGQTRQELDRLVRERLAENTASRRSKAPGSSGRKGNA